MDATESAMDWLKRAAPLMDDEIREAVHAELAPCEPFEFWSAYRSRKPDEAEAIEHELGTPPWSQNAPSCSWHVMTATHACRECGAIRLCAGCHDARAYCETCRGDE